MQSYWQNYYKNGNIPSAPSLFAQEIINFEFKTPIKTVIEIGCGNGRDAYFLGHNYEVVAIDNANLPKPTEKVTFRKCSMDTIRGNFDLLYSRFSLHSVSEDIENAVLAYAFNNCKFIAIEARSVNDPLCKHTNEKNECSNKTSYADKHYRRFIDLDTLCNKMQGIGFNILHASESDKYAPYKDDKPFCVRIIAQSTII